MATRKKKDQKPEPSKVEIYSGRKQILCPMQPCVVRPDATSPPITSIARDPAPSSARLDPSPCDGEGETDDGTSPPAPLSFVDDAQDEGENGEDGTSPPVSLS